MIIEEVRRIMQEENMSEEDAIEALDLRRTSKRCSLDKLYKVLKAEKLQRKQATAIDISD